MILCAQRYSSLGCQASFLPLLLAVGNEEREDGYRLPPPMDCPAPSMNS